MGAGGSADDYEVRHYSTKSTTGRNTVYRSRTKLADTTNVYYECIGDAFSAGDDAHLARVNRVKVETTVVATYKYLGAGHVVGTDYDEPDVFSRRYGAAAGEYDDLDRFDRVEDWDWTRDLATDRNFYDVGVAYDRNSNITSVDDRVHGGFDAAYTNDGLDRLSRAEEGTLSGGSISSRTRDQQWTLEQTGNWDFDKLDLNGDGDFVDASELNDDRTHNVVNELTARDTDDNGSNNHTLSYNARGDMTSDGDDYTYKYDAFGRLREVWTITSPALVAEYKYNGLGFRIGWHYDADADGTVENTTDDPWYLFVYDERWRPVNTYRLANWSYDASNPSAANSKERFVYYSAGLGGWGGSSYIDAVILRDRDMNTAWNAASDGTLEKRHYYCQNWRADVSAIVDSSGKLVEWIKYSAYGVPYSFPAGDTDSDLDWDATDSAEMGDGDAYDVRQDADLDGDNDTDDATHANSIKPGTGYQTLGRGVQSSTGVENRKSYAGYEYDPTFKGAGRVLMHVRHRVYDAELGRWGRRDPAGYSDGPNLTYLVSRPINTTDQSGKRADCIVQRSCSGDGEDNGFHPPPPFCYACSDGEGEQVANPASACDYCCTTVCNASPGAGGVVACCGYDKTICKCTQNTNRIVRSDCLREQVNACTLRHEQRHHDNSDCAAAQQCNITPATDRRFPPKCSYYCSECEQAMWDWMCYSAINCDHCSDPVACYRELRELLTTIELLSQRNCQVCEFCLLDQHNGAAGGEGGGHSRE